MNNTLIFPYEKLSFELVKLDKILPKFVFFKLQNVSLFLYLSFVSMVLFEAVQLLQDLNLFLFYQFSMLH